MNPKPHQTDSAASEGKLLLVDDDVELCSLMKEYFTSKGYALDAVNNGRDGLARALEEKHDLVILDGMLPVLDGFEVLRQLRKRSTIPVIMLTARTQERDRIQGLDAGADDYLPKPFGPDELMARIRAVLRRYRTERPVANVLQVGDIELNPETRVVRHGNEVVNLTEIEFQVLELLMRSVGRVVTRDEIMGALYQRESTPYERSLDVHVSHLRKKLETDSAPLIRTVRGAGYMLAPAED